MIYVWRTPAANDFLNFLSVLFIIINLEFFRQRCDSSQVSMTYKLNSAKSLLATYSCSSIRLSTIDDCKVSSDMIRYRLIIFHHRPWIWSPQDQSLFLANRWRSLSPGVANNRRRPLLGGRRWPRSAIRCHVVGSRRDRCVSRPFGCRFTRQLPSWPCQWPVPRRIRHRIVDPSHRLLSLGRRSHKSAVRCGFSGRDVDARLAPRFRRMRPGLGGQRRTDRRDGTRPRPGSSWTGRALSAVGRQCYSCDWFPVCQSSVFAQWSMLRRVESPHMRLFGHRIQGTVLSTA